MMFFTRKGVILERLTTLLYVGRGFLVDRMTGLSGSFHQAVGMVSREKYLFFCISPGLEV